MSSASPKWRYTWETQSHIPTLRLFIFNPSIKPSNHCKNLKVSLHLEQSLLLVSWDDQGETQLGSSGFSLKVPVPRVLVDGGSPVDFKAMEDHIVVKLALLLPVNHPLNLNIGSVLDEGSDGEEGKLDRSKPLSVESDMKCLSSQNGVNLFCKSCSMKLTRRPLRSFVEMPSADWREVADNWFGSCCCSFGGISEKLVRKYVSSYIFAQGTCLVDAASIIVGKNDLEACVVSDCFDQSKENDCGCDAFGENSLSESRTDFGSNGGQSLYSGNQYENTSDANKEPICNPIQKENSIGYLENDVVDIQNRLKISCFISPAMLEPSVNVAPLDVASTNVQSHCCIDMTNEAPSHYHESFSHDFSFVPSKDQNAMGNMPALKDDESLINVSLGSGFMVKTSNLSKNVNWIELHCTQCSSLLGAYPSANDGHAPLDGGIRFLKCYASTGLPADGSGNIFRNHTLQRMFANELIEGASDELSFRTVVRDIKNRSPILQIVLLNSDVWSCTGYCLEIGDTLTLDNKIDLHPVVKVLFADCSNPTEDQSRILEKWIRKNQADEIYMLKHEIKELINTLESAIGRLPVSFSSMQGLSLSSIDRMIKGITREILIWVLCLINMDPLV